MKKIKPFKNYPLLEISINEKYKGEDAFIQIMDKKDIVFRINFRGEVDWISQGKRKTCKTNKCLAKRFDAGLFAMAKLAK